MAYTSWPRLHRISQSICHSVKFRQYPAYVVAGGPHVCVTNTHCAQLHLCQLYVVISSAAASLSGALLRSRSVLDRCAGRVVRSVSTGTCAGQVCRESDKICLHRDSVWNAVLALQMWQCSCSVQVQECRSGVCSNAEFWQHSSSGSYEAAL